MTIESNRFASARKALEASLRSYDGEDDSWRTPELKTAHALGRMRAAIDPDEKTSFVGDIAVGIEAGTQEIRRLQAEVNRLRRELDAARDRQDALDLRRSSVK